MPVLQLVRDCSVVPTGPPAGSAWQLESVCIDRDGPAVARLVSAVAAGSDEARLRGPGLLAELTGRPGRRVAGWMAVPPGASDGGLLGLVSLVTVRTAGPPRFSLGWLLVHPAARRQGVGRSLVEHASRRARELAAERVWVDVQADWPAAVAFWRAVGFHEPESPRPLV